MIYICYVFWRTLNSRTYSLVGKKDMNTSNYCTVKGLCLKTTIYGKYHKHSDKKDITCKCNWLMLGRWWDHMKLCEICYFFLGLEGCSELALLGDHFLCFLCFCTYCQQRHWLHFSRLSFQGYLYSKQLWKIEILSLSEAKRQHTVQYKRFS